jgi:hypothetical protein
MTRRTRRPEDHWFRGRAMAAFAIIDLFKYAFTSFFS